MGQTLLSHCWKGIQPLRLLPQQCVIVYFWGLAEPGIISDKDVLDEQKPNVCKCKSMHIRHVQQQYADLFSQGSPAHVTESITLVRLTQQGVKWFVSASRSRCVR